MGYKDLREFIAQLEQAGELQRIRAEVDWDLEISAIMRKIYEIDGPACLFENVKGSRFPVLSGAFYRHKKYGLAIDAPPDLRTMLNKVMTAMNNPIQPTMVASGPCKQNIDTGDKIDLEIFPSPKWHHLDGGRYIGTLGVIITKDPETGARNVAVYREQLLGKAKTGLNPTQHAGIHLQKYRAMKKPMPIATAIGVPPAVLAASTSAAPFGVDEYEIAGALAGEPIPLVKCETVDLEVPADSEMVIEGEVPPDDSLWEMEGPFGEYTGHFCTVKPLKKPTVYVSAVTYRDNPIYQGCSPGVPPNEETTYREIGLTAGAWHKLLKSGVPGIKEVYATEMGVAGYVIVVSMDRQYYLGNARQVIHAVFGAVFMAKWVIVVDDDVDIYDWDQVGWALAVRVQPHRDIIIEDDRHTGGILDPSIHHDQRIYPAVQSSKIGIDATTKFKGFEFAPVVRTADEQKKLIERRWKEYGFK